MKVSGVLRKITAKSGVSARGKWTAYSLGVDTGGGDLDWYRYGFDAPNVQEGSVVSFDATEKKPGEKYVTKDTLTVDKKATAKVKPAEDNRQDSIVRQNACGTAARLVRDMIDTGAIELPKKAADRYEAYLGYLTEVTNFLFVTNRNPPSVADLEDAGVPGTEDSDDEEEDDEDVWPET